MIQQLGPDLFCCADCGHDTKLMGERYMLTDEVWIDEVIADRWAYMLCIGCAEVRSGRRFRSADFIACPLNYGTRFDDHSLRLRDRLTA